MSNGRGSSRPRQTGWTFVDDRKHTVRLTKRPTRIVAYSSAAAALYDWGVTPVGVFGEIDAEALRSVKSELIVSRWYPPPDDTPVFGFKDLKLQNTIGSQAPIVGIDGDVIGPRQIDRFGDLAHALGVSRTSEGSSQARSAFAKAEANLSRTARRKSNLRIIAVSADQNTLFVSTLSGCDMALYEQRGVPLVSANSSNAYWDSLPWEEAGKYPADAILYDARADALPLAAARRIPAFAEQPAVRANQSGMWRADPPPCTRDTTTVNELASMIAGWRKVI